MSRVSSIQYAEVSSACTKLFLDGESVSLPKVYALIGNKGSSRVVQAYIEQWRRETADKMQVTLVRDLPGVPDGVVASADDLLVKIWQGALAQADDALQQARGRLDLERAEIAAERERNAATLHDLEGSLLETRTLLQERDRELGELKGAYQDQGARSREREARITAQAEEIARLSATLDAGQERHAADLAAAHTRGEELLAEARRQHSLEIEREREQAVGERNHLMSTTDQIRTAARLVETDLREQLQASKAFSDSYRMRAGNLENELARWRGRAEAAESLLEKLTTKRRKPAAPSQGAQA
jgi:hypothetical protein